MTKFRVDILQIDEVKSLEGDWRQSEYVELLEALNLEGTAELAASEVEEVCLMALQDREPTAAAAVILKHRLGDVLTDGQIQNFSSECQHERLWEQSADLELHRPMFAVASLLARVDD